MWGVLRDTIRYGRGDYTPTHRGRGEWELIQRALRELDEWKLVEGGRITYQDLGYRTVDGQVPAWKIRRHRLVSAMRSELLEG